MAEERDPGREAEDRAASSGELGDVPGWEDEPARAEPPRTATEPPADSGPSEAAARASAREQRRRSESPNMLPGRDVRRSGAERLLVRLIATCGIVAIGVAIAAIMHSSGSAGWIIGLVVSIVTVVLAAILWSSKML